MPVANKIHTSRNRLSGAVVLALMVSTLSLTGCGTFFGSKGYFRDRGDDYLKAQTVPPIKLPDNVKADNIGQLFVIPPIAEPDAPVPDKYEVPRPTSSNAITAERQNTVKIQKLGDRIWIAINRPPSAVWPSITTFLTERNLYLAVLDPSMGIAETNWLSTQSEPDKKDRYRIRLEEGLRSDTTEVHVLQLTVPASIPGGGQINWPAHSVNPQREAWMVNELSAHLAKENALQASMRAQAIGSSERKVKLVSVENQDPYLDIRLDKERVWASVTGAMNHNGFAVDDDQHDQGYLKASYSAARAKAELAEQEKVEVEKPGIFSRIGKTFGMGSSKNEADTQAFQVVVTELDEGMRVTVRSADGQPLAHIEADKWLRLIRANLL
jgi:outer membrane protein assembly factor BamC